MADLIRKVLQRKRAFLNKFLSDISDQQLRRLRELDLINDESLLMLMKTGATSKLMEHIILGEETHLDVFMEFLQLEFVWIYDEIGSEVKAESLSLDLDDYEVEEASALIHRHFGRSKRFAEKDKKTMTALVATRSQVAKEIWKYRLAAITQVLDEVKARLKDMEEAIKSTDEVIRSFLRRHQLELHDFSYGLKSTSQTLLDTSGTSNEDLFEAFLKRVTYLVDRFRKALFENQSLLNQKKECMKILDCPIVKSPLDYVLAKAIRAYSDEQKNNQNRIKSLEAQNHGLEKDIKKRDGQITLFQLEIQRLKLEADRASDVLLPPIDGMNRGGSVSPWRSPKCERKIATVKGQTQTNANAKPQTKNSRRCALNLPKHM